MATMKMNMSPEMKTCINKQRKDMSKNYPMMDNCGVPLSVQGKMTKSTAMKMSKSMMKKKKTGGKKTKPSYGPMHEYLGSSAAGGTRPVTRRAKANI